MKRWIVWVLAAALCGCGTVRTLSNESKAVDDLAQYDSYCHSLPRAYSGVAYQYCTLNGPVRPGEHWAPYPVVVDMAMSGVVDTLLLPYTGYQQYTRGNMPIRRLRY